MAWMTKYDYVLFVVSGFGAVTFILCGFYRDHKRMDLKCPGCTVTLVAISAQVAIATGHCGHCGAKLFSEENTPVNTA